MGTPEQKPPHALPTDGVTLTHAAWVYDWLEPPMMFFQQGRIARATAAAAGIHDGDRVLDLGCATGVLMAEASYLTPNGESVGAAIPFLLRVPAGIGARLVQAF